MATFRFDRALLIFTSQGGGGQFRIHGFAPGATVDLEMDGEFNKLEVGEDGEPAWSQDLAALAGKCTFRLQQSSTSNADIGAQVALDELDGTGYGTLQVLDPNSGTSGEGAGRFAQQAKASFGAGLQPREWVFRFERLKITHAGITQR